jgi:integrase/recombinase XerD
MDALFAEFLQQRKWTANLTPKSIAWYEAAWTAFRRHTPEVTTPAALTKLTLQQFVVRAREASLCGTSVNTHLKALNAFCSWLHEEEHHAARVRLPLLRTESKLIPTLDEVQLKRLLTPPTRRHKRELRAYVLAMLLLDTGLRIEEALTLRVGDIDFDNLLLRVMGKGRKERLIPFSVTLRALLVRWLKRRLALPTDWMFVTRAGTRCTQRNALRAHYELLRHAGIPKCGFHRLRHTFATQYLRHGGELVRLSRILGHSQITTTMRYLHLQTADLQTAHQQLSVLNRLR